MSSIHISAKETIQDPGEKLQKKAANVAPIKSISLMDQFNDILASFTPIRTEDKVTFFRLLATMINAGISIVNALNILKQQTENPHFKTIVNGIIIEIEGGNSFSEALGTFSEYFSESQIGMIQMGEASGHLDNSLLQIAEETEKSADLAKKIKGAMIYPVVVMGIMLIAGFAIMNFVMPKIKTMFDSLGTDLPPMTQVLISTSDFFVGHTLAVSNTIWMILAMISISVIFVQWKKTSVGRLIWADIFFKIPIFGPLVKKVVLARFCRSIAILVGSGISIVKALRITAKSVGNPLYERRIGQIADDVEQGITIGENIKDDPKYFPIMVSGMISVAEQTAQIDAISSKLATFYETEVDDMVKNLSSLLEPVIIVVLGVAVGFMVIAVMLPILQSSDLASFNG